MGLDADELILRPFREVIERGNEAVANAGDDDDDVAVQLAKAGHALVREGERALKRLQPVWDNQVEKYGDAFKEAMLQLDEMEKKRLELEDLLYDFEDYIEVDSFSLDKFSTIQAATRSFALDAINHAKRLKLESPQPQAWTFPPLPPLPPLPPMPREDRRSVTSMQRVPYMKTIHPRALPASTAPPSVADLAEDEAPLNMKTRPRSQLSSSGSSLDPRRRNTHSSTATSSSRGLDVDRGQSLTFTDEYSTQIVERRPSSPTMTANTASGQDPSNFSPPTPIRNGADVVRAVAARPTIVDVTSHPAPASEAPCTSAWVRNHQTIPARSRSNVRSSINTEYSSGEIPVMLSRFNSMALDRSGPPSVAPSVFDQAPGSPSALTDSRTSFFSSAANSCTSGSPVIYTSPDMPPLPPSGSIRELRGVVHWSPLHVDIARSMSPPPIHSPSLQSQSYSATLPPPAMPSPTIQDLINFDMSPSLPAMRLRLSPRLDRWREEQEEELANNGKEPRSPPLLPRSPIDGGPAQFNLPPASLPSDPSDHHFDHGLMVVDENAVPETSRSVSVAGTTDNLEMSGTRQYVREADCSIGAKSSFNMLGGFCKGAESFRVGGHWQGIKQTGGYVANKQTTIGRCVSCGYAHNFEEVRIDMEKKPEATFTNAGGVRFRLRLLYKSHISNNIASQRQAESNYGCIFCIQAASTVREGDATVFTSPDQLLLHLARHPQPLPVVPGLTVIYGELDPASELANDFDLHLVRPPLPTPVPPSVGQAAVATAVRDHLQRYGAKKLVRPDGYAGDMLQFLTGARIVGLTFPERWEGKWCMGWHDGLVGAFPAKTVQIEPPRQSEIPMASSSGMSVKARWKWKPSEAKEKRDKKDKNRIEEEEVVVDENGESHKSAEWLDFETGEIIHDVKCLYADHWCWAGTNSKGRYGVFPQSHIMLKTLQQEAQGLQRPRTGWSSKGKGLFGKGGSSRRPLSSSGASSISSSTRT